MYLLVLKTRGGTIWQSRKHVMVKLTLVLHVYYPINKSTFHLILTNLTNRLKYDGNLLTFKTIVTTLWQL